MRYLAQAPLKRSSETLNGELRDAAVLREFIMFIFCSKRVILTVSITSMNIRQSIDAPALYAYCQQDACLRSCCQPWSMIIYINDLIRVVLICMFPIEPRTIVRPRTLTL